MTILEAIQDCKEKRPNQFSDEDMIGWLSDVELNLVHGVFSKYEGFEKEKAFTGYEKEVDQNQGLLLKAPYDSLYRYWLYAMVDLHNNDITRYNMAATMYTQQEAAFKTYMVQNFKPLQRAKINHKWLGKNKKTDLNNPLG